MTAAAAAAAVVGLTDVAGNATSAVLPVRAPSVSPSVSVDTSVRDERVSRGDLRPALTAPQQGAQLGVDREALAMREARLEAMRQAVAEKKRAEAEKKAEAKKKRAAAAKKKAAEARIKKLGYKPGTTDPRSIAKQILKNKYDYGDDQYQCFNNIIIRESNWDIDATNASSGAYGIPQSLPGSKMASEGDDWRTNPATQITWGIEYMKDRYGSPCSAWGFKSSHGWY